MLTVSVSSVPEAVPLPYVIEKAVLVVFDVLELEDEYVVVSLEQPTQLEVAMMRSAEPVSMITSKSVAGVPTEIVP